MGIAIGVIGLNKLDTYFRDSIIDAAVEAAYYNISRRTRDIFSEPQADTILDIMTIFPDATPFKLDGVLMSVVLTPRGGVAVIIKSKTVVRCAEFAPMVGNLSELRDDGIRCYGVPSTWLG